MLATLQGIVRPGNPAPSEPETPRFGDQVREITVHAAADVARDKIMEEGIKAAGGPAAADAFGIASLAGLVVTAGECPAFVLRAEPAANPSMYVR